MAGTLFDCPLTVNTSVKHCVAVVRAAPSGLERTKLTKSNLANVKLCFCFEEERERERERE
jgi:hypothetical protein